MKKRSFFYASLFFLSCFLQASDAKKMKTNHKITMYQAFINLATQNPKKSLDDLEQQVWKSIKLNDLIVNQNLIQSQRNNFEDKHMDQNIAQLCAIFRIKFFLQHFGVYTKNNGIIDQYFQDRYNIQEK